MSINDAFLDFTRYRPETDELLEMDGEGVSLSLSELRSLILLLEVGLLRFSNGLLCVATSMSEAILCPAPCVAALARLSCTMYWVNEPVGIDVEYVLREGEARLRDDDHSSRDSSSVIEALLDRDRESLPIGFGDDGVDPHSEGPPASINDDLLDRTRYFPLLPFPEPFPTPVLLPAPGEGCFKYELCSQSLGLVDIDVARLDGLRLALPVRGW
jgi:hypothetical protein